MNDIIKIENYSRVIKESKQGSRITIRRENIELAETISPSYFLRLLQDKLEPQNRRENGVEANNLEKVPIEPKKQSDTATPPKSNVKTNAQEIASWKLQAFLAMIFTIVAIIAFVLAMLATSAGVGGDLFVAIHLGAFLLKTTPLILGTAAASLCVVSTGLSLALVPSRFFNAANTSAPQSPSNGETPRPDARS